MDILDCNNHNLGDSQDLEVDNEFTQNETKDTKNVMLSSLMNIYETTELRRGQFKGCLSQSLLDKLKLISIILLILKSGIAQNVGQNVAYDKLTIIGL